MRRAVLALVPVLALAACTSKNVSFTGELRHGKTAEENYRAGVEELARKGYPEAIKFFEYVKARFPYSAQAALADLRIADAMFEQGRYVEAADAYEQFAKLRPTHDEVDYAEFRVGVAQLRDAPSDFFMFPPPHEKDLRTVERAARSFEAFVGARPESKHVPEARRLLQEARTQLAAHEWYVAEYYFKRRKWAGAAGRYAALVERYPGSRNEGEALYKLARSWLELEERQRAQKALQQLVVKHPDDPRRPEAERLLASLR